MNYKELGMLGENAAADFLCRKKGYTIVCRNYRSSAGEIDMIAQDGNTLVFVEVKTRKTTEYGRPAEAVERRKQHKIAIMAKSYLARYGLWSMPCRFDVVEVMPDCRTGFVINHIIHAFILQ
ncbi:hypothetical protein AB840_02515 [Megasphaera cerevisiae DSM 20462]|jgi:putative endonuclease|uniref:UPF0102 protein AB840_02515 n=1 Tax=Megasphaera cerevisiae DSM 20462 TaxID=1122219 RepID=A0A0J6WYV6_9FIRM|nr:YraN family protein [Megasphaera cerevisiae]KMO87443.1 hypothetical protein AB840_02515 [Megasphaera cerevisiae DSM 20462]MCI1750759.1 YraN family protein [Megasphaera cerevisiae]OKY53937.1 YraN family protein [Megasphaera cerevisiae]SJZ36474.1 putative endonuclease [Megasphaera cerevisiae DSM 20462]